jgi:hypothetical protein
VLYLTRRLMLQPLKPGEEDLRLRLPPGSMDCVRSLEIPSRAETLVSASYQVPDSTIKIGRTDTFCLRLEPLTEVRSRVIQSVARQVDELKIEPYPLRMHIP